MDFVGRRLLWNVLPVAALIGVVYLAVLGDDGLFARHRVAGDLATTRRQLSELDEENARLVREVRQLRDDDVTLRRAAAEELLLVPPGSTVVRFDEHE